MKTHTLVASSASQNQESGAISSDRGRFQKHRSVVCLVLTIIALMVPLPALRAANSLGECYVTVNVTGDTLPAGWSYQLQYFDTDSNWYNGASGISTQTYYKQQGDWLNKSIQWRCQLKQNNSNYGSPQTNTCYAGSDSVSFSVAAPVTATPPTITGQPSSQSVSVGAPATFTVSASGTAPLSYQWRKNGGNISGATFASYTIASVSTGDAGNYSCYVSNSAGNATSQEASLTVNGGQPSQSATFPNASDWVRRASFANYPHPEMILSSMQASGEVFYTSSHYSSDGVTWQALPWPNFNNWINGAGYGAGTFVLTGAGGQIFTSSNFTNWTTRSPGGDDITQVAFGNGTFVARKFWNTGDMWVSKNNGVSWTSVDTGDAPDRGYNELEFGNGRFIHPLDNRVRTSVDGLNWTTQTIASVPSGFLMRYCQHFTGEKFIGAAESARSGTNVTIVTGTSVDGASWTFKKATIQSSSVAKFFTTGADPGNLLLLSPSAPAEVWLSKDEGSSWSKIDGPWATSDNHVAFFGLKGDMVAVSTSTEIYSAPINSNFVVTVESNTNGQITGAGDYATTSTATLTAVPNPGYIFTGWTGDASGATSPLEILMDSDKNIGATFSPDLTDSDGDGLSAYDEVVIHRTNPALADTDGDGISDGTELGIGRYSVVFGSRTWTQAKADAESRVGHLATFATEGEWTRTMDAIGVDALLDIGGLWIGAADETVEGTWTWITGEPFTFAPWASGQPDNLNNSDFAAVAGELGGESGKWYDYRATTSRDGYILEIGYSTSPTDSDSDDDGLSDGVELSAGSNPFLTDTDSDGLTDSQEVNLTHTNPALVDTDGDSIPDGADDQDGDGVANRAEITEHGTDSLVADSDGDGLSDGVELGLSRRFFKAVIGSFTHPQALADAASRRGRLASFPASNDYTSVISRIRRGTQGFLWIGLSDAETEGTWKWSDGTALNYNRWLNGQPDGGTAENHGVVMENLTTWADAVAEFAATGYVFVRTGLDPLDPDTDGDGLSDGAETHTTGTDPFDDDTDSDGLADGAELNTHGSDPKVSDTDGDGLGDYEEVITRGTNPAARDTDGDGFDDPFEINTGFDPKLATSTPDAMSSIRTAVEFRFNAANGVSYRIEDSTDLQNWNTVEALIIGQGGVVTRFYSTENLPRRYFRVRRN